MGFKMNADNKKIAKAVKRICAGDGNAFETLYNLTAKSAYFTALKIVKSEHDAEDVLQESYMTVLDKINTLDKPESFMSWFNMIVANKAKEILRKNNKFVFVDIDNPSGEQSDAPTEAFEENNPEFIPGAEIEQRELREQVMSLIDNLSDDKRTIILLYYYNDLSVRQIAESLDISEGTVKSRLYHARAELSEGIKEYESKHLKLLSIAPVALIIWALKASSVTTSAAFVMSGAASATLAAITAQSAVTGSAIAGAAATGGGIAAKVIGFTAVQKAVAAAATVAIVGGAAGTTVAITNNSKDNSPSLQISETQTEIPSSEDYFLLQDETPPAAAEAASRAGRKSASTSAPVTIPVTAQEIKTEGRINETAAESSAHTADDRGRDITSTTRIRITAAKTTAAAKAGETQITSTAPASAAAQAAENRAGDDTSATSAVRINAAKRLPPEKTAAGAETSTASAPQTATTAVHNTTTAAPKTTAAKPTQAKTTAAPAPRTTAKSQNEPQSAANPEPESEKTTQAPRETQTEAPKPKTSELKLIITQGGEYADSIIITLNEGDRFTFADAKAAAEAKGYDTAFAEYSGEKLPLTAGADENYIITIDVE